MNEMTQIISEVKAQVSREEWEQRIMSCQQSGMSVRSCCRENGVTTGAYYHHLRKIRESMLTEKEIVPLKKPRTTANEGIRIESGELLQQAEKRYPLRMLGTCTAKICGGTALG